MRIAIPCVLMRGGSSRGPFLLADDLPRSIAKRDAVLLALMGSPHGLQVDGVGGGHPQTSKVAIVSRSQRPDCDVDYLFAQVAVEARTVDTRPNCGNMLAGVGPFAIEAGLVNAQCPSTIVRIFNVNSGARIDAVVATPDGAVTYDGDTKIPGVEGTAAPVRLVFREFNGGKTGKVFPTGQCRDIIDGVSVTLIDSAMVMMLIDGRDVGLKTPACAARLSQDQALMRRIEAIRIAGGCLMGLGDVSASVIPKVGLLLPSKTSHIAIAYLMPWKLHTAVAVTGAIAVAFAAANVGTVAERLSMRFDDEFQLEHPSGVMSLHLTRADGQIEKAAVIRTARRIFEGRAFVPARHYE